MFDKVYKTKMKYTGRKVLIRKSAIRRPRRRYVRKTVPMRSIRPMLPDFMKTQRKFWVQNWTPGTAATNDFWRLFAPTLGDIPNFNDYTNIYDSYKITKFKVHLVPRYDGFQGNDTVDTVLPGVTNQGATRVHVAIDPKCRNNDGPTGAYTSATLNLFLERSRARTYTGNKPLTFTCRYPCVLSDVNANSNAKAEKAGWYQTNITNIGHRGIHVFLQDINLTGTFGQSFDVFYTLDVMFKGQR